MVATIRERSPGSGATIRAQDFEAQVYRTSRDRTVMQARKESLWRQLLGSPTGGRWSSLPERVS